MYISVSPSHVGAVITLEEPDDCTRFHVAIQNLSEDEVLQALKRDEVGSLSASNTAWIKIGALRQFAKERVRPDWPERFEGMLRYAERKGWLSDDKTMVSGHCEWRSE